MTSDELLSPGASEAARERAHAMTALLRGVPPRAPRRDHRPPAPLLPASRAGAHSEAAQGAGREQIQRPPRGWTPDALWQAYETLEKSRVRGSGRRVVTDLVSLVRFALEQETILAPFAETVKDRFAAWLSDAGGDGQPVHARAASLAGDDPGPGRRQPDRRDGGLRATSPFSEKGGLGKAYELFGERLSPLLEELNEVLVG